MTSPSLLPPRAAAAHGPPPPPLAPLGRCGSRPDLRTVTFAARGPEPEALEALQLTGRGAPQADSLRRGTPLSSRSSPPAAAERRGSAGGGGSAGSTAPSLAAGAEDGPGWEYAAVGGADLLVGPFGASGGAAASPSSSSVVKASRPSPPGRLRQGAQSDARHRRMTALELRASEAVRQRLQTDGLLRQEELFLQRSE
ncbi:unnamed protein product, partial [Prorocentrum cordatum]